MNIVYHTTDQRDIDRIEPLWHKLIDYHQERAVHFKDYFNGVRFADRRQQLSGKSKPFPLHIDFAQDDQKLIGYCLSSLTSDRIGEIESILVDEAYRGFGIGDAFMRQAINWLDDLKARRKIISVGEGNEGVFSFYRRYGFYPLVNSLIQTRPVIDRRSTQQLSSTGLRIFPGGPGDLDQIQPLWEKLTCYEGAITPVFRQHFEQRSFPEKKDAIHKVISDGQLHLNLIRKSVSNPVEGYCIGTLSADKAGKIESLYIEPECRSRGLGSRLMIYALDWMESRQSASKTLMTAAGNTRAIQFYARFNFYPRNTILQQVKL